MCAPVFIELFTGSRRRRQAKCPTPAGWAHTVWCTHAAEYLFRPKEGRSDKTLGRRGALGTLCSVKSVTGQTLRECPSRGPESAAETEREWWGRGWEGEGAYCVEGAGCQLGRTKRVLWADAGDGCSEGAHPVPRAARLENGHGGKLDVMSVFLA